MAFCRKAARFEHVTGFGNGERVKPRGQTPAVGHEAVVPETQERCHHGLGRRTASALEVLRKLDRQKARGRHVGPGADAPPERTLVELLSGLHGDVALRSGRDGRGALHA